MQHSLNEKYHRVLGKGKNQEYTAVEMWSRGQEIVIINYGDLNTQNTLWGGRYINVNG